MGATPKNIPLSKLSLDFQNPRLDNPESTKDVMAAMLEQQGQRNKILRLAEDIVEHGLDPSSSLIVIPHEEKEDRFVVVEGNRRITALKLLGHPENAGKYEKRFKPLADRLPESILKAIPCVVFSTREETSHWIKLKHTGENDGAGVVTWGGTELARFEQGALKRNRPGLQVLDFLKKHVDLDTELKNAPQKFSITTLERIIQDLDVREKLGLTIEKGHVYSEYPADETTKCLLRIVRDLVSGDFNVKDVYFKTDRKKYIDGLGEDRPDPAKRLKEKHSLADLPSRPPSPTGTGTTPATRGKSTRPRRTLIPSTFAAEIGHQRLRAICHELKKLPVEDYPNAAAVMLRVFLELSLDHVLSNLKVQHYTVDHPLPKKLQFGIAQIVERKTMTDMELKPIRTAVANKHSILSIDTLHACVHNPSFAPSPGDARTMWDGVQLFLEKLWDLSQTAKGTKP